MHAAQAFDIYIIKMKQNSQTTSCNVKEITQKVNMVCVNLIFVAFPVKDYS